MSRYAQDGSVVKGWAPSRVEVLCALIVALRREPGADATRARTIAQELAEGRPRLGQYVDGLTALGFKRFITEAFREARGGKF